MDSSSASRAAARRPWSAAEDEALRRLVTTEGPRRWDSLAKRLPIPGRGGKSCRLRWRHHLHPAVSKRPFAAQEDRIIVGAFSAIGPKWAEMAKNMEGRTDGSIKNRWHSHLKKKYPELLAKYLAEDATQANVLTFQQQGVEFSAQHPENIVSIQKHPSSLVHSDGRWGSLEIASHSQSGEPNSPVASTVHISPPAGGSNPQFPSFSSTNCVDQQTASCHGGCPTGKPSLDRSIFNLNTPLASPSPALVPFLHSPNKKTAEELLQQGSPNIAHAISAKSSVEFTSESWSSSSSLEQIMTSSWQSSTFSGGLPLDRTNRQEKNAPQLKHSLDSVQDSLLETKDRKSSTQELTCYNIPLPASVSSSMAALPPSIQQFADGNFFTNSGILDPQVSDWEGSSMGLSDHMTDSALQETTNQDSMASLLDILFMASNNQSCGTSSSLDCLQEDSYVSTLETVMLEELIWTGIPLRDSPLPPPLVDGNTFAHGGPPYFVDLPPLNFEYNMNMPH